MHQRETARHAPQYSRHACKAMAADQTSTMQGPAAVVTAAAASAAGATAMQCTIFLYTAAAAPDNPGLAAAATGRSVCCSSFSSSGQPPLATHLLEISAGTLNRLQHIRVQHDAGRCQ
jgi:hypothetical protein